MSEETAKRLTPEQKALLLTWIAEGCESDEINKRAAQQAPPFTVAKSTISHYRSTRQLKIADIQQQSEAAAIAAGFATAAERVAWLTRLAKKLGDELLEDGKLWTKMRKGLGKEGSYEYEEFNAAEIQQFRGLLDDIARELGGRALKIKEETEVDIIWDLPVPNYNPSDSGSAPAKS